MFESLARRVVRRGFAWAVVGVTFAVAAGSLVLASGVEHDDDLLAFLPEGNEAIATFTAVNRRFGGLQMAIVGIEAGDAVDGDFLERLQRTTTRLSTLPSLSHVLSLTNVEDFRPDPSGGGIITGPLVGEVPRTDEAEAALRDKVMSRDHIVGNLISADGRAVQIFCTLNADADPRTAATSIRRVAREGLGDGATLHWGGNPFISSYIYDTTQADMRRLTPWAILAIVLLMVFAFRDLVGSCLALISTGVGILIAIGAMALAGEPFNVVLGGMPIILFAVGSAYAIHILTRYFAQARHHPPQEAIARTLTTVGPTVVAAGLTTVAGLLSFVMMDIAPIRTFGVFTALGILATLILSLTFVPAVVVLTGIRGRRPTTSHFEAALGRFVASVRRHRVTAGLGLAAVALSGAAFAGQVESRMDPKAFYGEGSPPARADAFMGAYFGGSEFMQIHARGDMKDPYVLRRIRWIADRVAALDGVTGVLHVGQPIALANDAMEGEKRIPDSRAKAALLFNFLSGQRSLRQLVTDERDEALIHVRMDTLSVDASEALLERVEALVAEETARPYVLASVEGARGGAVAARLREMVVGRIRAAAAERGLGLDAEASARLSEALGGLGAGADREEMVRDVVRYLRSDEALVDLPEAEGDEDPARAVAEAAVDLGPEPAPRALEAAIAGALGEATDAETVADLAFSLEVPLAEIRRGSASRGASAQLVEVAGLPVPEGGVGERFRREVAMALLDLRGEAALLPSEGPADDAVALSMDVTGMPVLHRGLSESVTANQLRSLGFAVGLVLIIMIGLFRSVRSGLLGTAPMAITLLAVYGAMGAMDVQLDIGTSMLASLIIGAGVDYAVHLLAAWRAPAEGDLAGAAARATETTGAGIWTNAGAVCAGFFILTLGDAKPLQNVGGLTAAAMITAALATFVAIPVMARRSRYTRTPALGVAAEATEPAAAHPVGPPSAPERGALP